MEISAILIVFRNLIITRAKLHFLMKQTWYQEHQFLGNAHKKYNSNIMG